MSSPEDWMLCSVTHSFYTIPTVLRIVYMFVFRALQEAQDIFGVDFDYADFEQYEGEYDEEEEEDEVSGM